MMTTIGSGKTLATYSETLQTVSSKPPEADRHQRLFFIANTASMVNVSGSLRISRKDLPTTTMTLSASLSTHGGKVKSGILKNTLTKLKANTDFPGKDVAVVETGYPWTLEQNDPYNNNFVKSSGQLHPGYEATKWGQQKWVRDIKNVVAKCGGLGVLYWAPDWINVGSVGGKWENAAMFDFWGWPLPSLKEMGRPLSGSNPTPKPAPSPTPNPTPSPITPPPPAPQQTQPKPRSTDEWRGVDINTASKHGKGRNQVSQQGWL